MVVNFDDINPKVSPKLEALKPKSFDQSFTETSSESLDKKERDYFTVILVIICVVFSMFFTSNFGAIAAAIFGVVLFVVGVVVKNIRDNNLYYRSLAKSTEPFFICSEFRGDTTVCERAEELRKDLDKAWVNDQFRPKPPVYELIWGYGGETDNEWLVYSEEYKVRKIKEYHLVIMKSNPEYYKAVILGQKGVLFNI